jgi:hypothetical protein
MSGARVETMRTRASHQDITFQAQGLKPGALQALWVSWIQRVQPPPYAKEVIANGNSGLSRDSITIPAPPRTSAWSSARE